MGQTLQADPIIKNDFNYEYAVIYKKFLIK